MRKKILIGAIFALTLLCAGLWSITLFTPEPVFLVENRKESLYSAENVPKYKGAGSININTATIEELCTLPGIGETIAERIISHREAYGAYPHPEAIMEVRGIGEKLYETIKDEICVK